MSISTSCCCKISLIPPTSNPSSISLNKAQVACPKKENKNSWRSQCVVGVACIIVGLEAGNLISGTGEAARAGEMHQGVVQSTEKGQRWSDKRTCPPWQLNSLESIVPENLPRPSAHRRWEAVGFSEGAPAVKVVTKVSTKCFSM